MKDDILVTIKSGNGGNGKASFFKGKKLFYKPSGGNGGNGGKVYLFVSEKYNDLSHLNSKFKAENGEDGGNDLQKGRNGKDLFIDIPIGTNISFENKDFFLNKVGKYLFLLGGTGGKGNSSLKNSQNKAPKCFSFGLPGKEIKVRFSMKLIANVALVGFPNSGKSTLVNTITNAKCKIGDYPFTTLKPKVAVCKKKFTIADIPGLIEGASKGKGLGMKFLKHIEKSKVIWHLIDITEKNLLEKFEIIYNELKFYDESLILKPQIIVLTKCDLIENVNINFLNFNCFKISSVKKLGIEKLLNETDNVLKKLTDNDSNEIDICQKEEEKIKIEIKNDRIYLKGYLIEKILKIPNLNQFILENFLHANQIYKFLKEKKIKKQVFVGDFLINSI